MGNKENVERYARFVPLFTRKGYEVWMPDYPGFGKSRGERNEKKLYSQAWQVYRLVNSAYHSDSIILYGKSFGTGLATYIASGNHCRELILETPYYSIPALFGHYAFISCRQNVSLPDPVVSIPPGRGSTGNHISWNR